MPKFGFSGGIPDTKVLILYTLCAFKKPAPLTRIAEVCMTEDNVNWFELCDALYQTVSSGHVILSEEDGLQQFAISPLGFETNDVMHRHVSASLRAEVTRLCKKIEERMELDRFIITDIDERGGLPYVCCEMNDGDTPLIHVELMIGSKSQADAITKNFRDNPGRLYDKMLTLLLGEADKKDL